MRQRASLSFLVLFLAIRVSAQTSVPAARNSEAPRPQDTDSGDSAQIWKLEHEYWDYVQKNNLTAYRSLWHEQFIGWPFVSDAPLHKDHITDWITAETSRGHELRSFDLKPAAIHLTGNIAVDYYWITVLWADSSGKGEPRTSRITHTWVRTPAGWQIFGGMSAQEPRKTSAQ
jgi:hypothetical protein